MPAEDFIALAQTRLSLQGDTGVSIRIMSPGGVTVAGCDLKTYIVNYFDEKKDDNTDWQDIILRDIDS